MRSCRRGSIRKRTSISIGPCTRTQDSSSRGAAACFSLTTGPQIRSSLKTSGARTAIRLDVGVLRFLRAVVELLFEPADLVDRVVCLVDLVGDGIASARARAVRPPPRCRDGEPDRELDRRERATCLVSQRNDTRSLAAAWTPQQRARPVRRPKVGEPPQDGRTIMCNGSVDR